MGVAKRGRLEKKQAQSTRQARRIGCCSLEIFPSSPNKVGSSERRVGSGKARQDSPGGRERGRRRQMVFSSPGSAGRERGGAAAARARVWDLEASAGTRPRDAGDLRCRKPNPRVSARGFLTRTRCVSSVPHAVGTAGPAPAGSLARRNLWELRRALGPRTPAAGALEFFPLFFSSFFTTSPFHQRLAPANDSSSCSGIKVGSFQRSPLLLNGFSLSNGLFF